MASKTLGFVFIIVGALVLIARFFVNSIFQSIPFLNTLSDLNVIILGAILIVIGFFLLKGKGGKGKHLAEVPIFEGERIVGYRRHK